MGLKYTAFTAAFKALDSVGADRWLRSLARGCGVILMLHHVRPQGRRKFAPNQALEITPEFLDIALTELRREGFEIIPLDKLPERLRLPKPTSRPFAILTFDDGYRDNVEYAWPILRRHKAPWTLFVTTDFLNGKGQLWWVELEEASARLESVVFT